MAPKKTFPLRIETLLWNELQAWASDELRSVNGQVEYILREAVKKRRAKAGSDLFQKRANPAEDGSRGDGVTQL